MKNDYMMKLKQFTVKSIHYFITLGLFYSVWILFRYGENLFISANDVGYRYNYLVTGGFAVLLAFFNKTYNSYLFGYSRIRTLAFAQFLAQLIPVVMIYITGMSMMTQGTLSERRSTITETMRLNE